MFKSYLLCLCNQVIIGQRCQLFMLLLIKMVRNDSHQYPKLHDCPLVKAYTVIELLSLSQYKNKITVLQDIKINFHYRNPTYKVTNKRT